MAKVEAAVKRVPNVTSFAYDATKHEITVGYSGYYKDVKDIKIALDGQSVPCEAINPARVVIRPIGKVEKPEGVIGAIKGVPGVVDASTDNNDLIAYADLNTLSLDTLTKAVEGAGVKCQIPSHEEIKVRYSAAGTVDALKSELQRTKWVLRVDIDAADSSVKVLAVRGRVTRDAVKAAMSKCGFPEAK
jgi:copper chaperone CopZ